MRELIAKSRQFDGQIFYWVNERRSRVPKHYWLYGLVLVDLIILWIMIERPDLIVGGFN